MNSIIQQDEYKDLFFPKKEDQYIIPSAKDISSEHLENDFELARNSINEVLNLSGNTLNNLLEILKQTDNARVGEVATNLMSTISTVSKDLLELHEKYSKLKNQSEQASVVNQTNIQNNIMFKGSSKGLLELIKEHSK